jgi:hypothetical protein
MSAYITIEELRLIMGLTFFALGLVAIITGGIMLIAHPYRDEAKTLATQSANLSQSASQSATQSVTQSPSPAGPTPVPGQKGVGEDISAAAQSATALVDAVNSLIKTSSGNAIVIIIVGALLEAAAYWLLIASA